MPVSILSFMTVKKPESNLSPYSKERFNEGTSIKTILNTQPDLETGVQVIKATISTLKPIPGVYRMLDGKGDVLYIGKARSLKARVLSYTNINQLSRRLQRMVSQCRSMEIVTTNSEAEALLLEAQLIKRHRPPFNVLLRDDKSFPFILLREGHDFPRIMKHRGARRAKGDYFGPFASAGSVNSTINALQKLFLLRSCSDSFYDRRERPCLLYQINRCSAPCVGRITVAEYAKLTGQAKDFLKGRSSQVQEDLEQQMQAASSELDFETAAKLRDRLRAATFIQGSQAINIKGTDDVDVFSLASEEGQVCVQAFFIRGGQNWGHRAFFPTHTVGVEDAQVLSNVILQFYEEVPPPRKILIDREIPELALMVDALTGLVGKPVSISVPKRGERLNLIKQASRNAAQALERRLSEKGSKAKIYREMAEFLELGKIPSRIEIFDNSHIQGSMAVGGLVVAGPDGFDKTQYRKFNIREAQTDDDYGMMREVLRRRFERAIKEDPERLRLEEGSIWPDLVLIDGGKGQLKAVKDTLDELGVFDIPLVAVAKGPNHGRDGKEVFHFMGGKEKSLPVNSPVLFYLQSLRDEAHRYVIGAHRSKRSRKIKASPLDQIPGVGAVRKRALLLHYGTASKVRAASLEDLKRVPGINAMVAQKVYDFYHTGG